MIFVFKGSDLTLPPIRAPCLEELLKDIFREGPPLLYKVTKQNTFTDGFIKCGKKKKRKAPLAAIFPKKQKRQKEQ